MSIENSACSGFFFFFLISGQFVVPPASVWVCVDLSWFVLSGKGQRQGQAPGCWLSAQSARHRLTSCHLHSTDTPEFCAELETVGSAKVSITAAVRELEDGEDDEDDEEAATAPAKRAKVNTNHSTSETRDRHSKIFT